MSMKYINLHNMSCPTLTIYCSRIVGYCSISKWKWDYARARAWRINHLPTVSPSFFFCFKYRLDSILMLSFVHRPLIEIQLDLKGKSFVFYFNCFTIRYIRIVFNKSNKDNFRGVGIEYFIHFFYKKYLPKKHFISEEKSSHEFDRIILSSLIEFDVAYFIPLGDHRFSWEACLTWHRIEDFSKNKNNFLTLSIIPHYLFFLSIFTCFYGYF